MFRVDPKDSEARLIIGAMNGDSLHRLSAVGITPGDLLVWGEVLRFINEYNSQHDRVPDLDTVAITFPDFPVPEKDTQDLDHWINVAIYNASKKKIRTMLTKAAVDLDGDTEAMSIVENLLATIPDIAVQGKTRATYIDNDPDERMEQYLKRKETVEAGKKLGIGTGVNVLDEVGIQYFPGDFAIIAGPPEVGKSLLMLKGCATAYLAKKRVMYVSPEMVEEDVTMRLYPMLAKEWGIKLSNDALQQGHGLNLDDYRDFLSRIANQKRFIVVDDIEGGVFTVPKLEALIKEYRPDFIAFDTLMLMNASDGSKAINWAPLLEVAYGLKFLAVRTKTIILATHPSTADTFDTKTPPTMGELGIGKYVSFALDLGISMSKSKKEAHRNLRVIKKRKGKGMTDILSMQFLPDTGMVG